MVDTQTVFAHIFEQTKQNIQLLVINNQLSANDGAEILAKLSRAASTQAAPPAHQHQLHSPPISPPNTVSPVNSYTSYTPSPAPYAQPPISAPRIRVKALWNYNGQEPEDLSFPAGSIIELLKETNAEWWQGEYNGKRGLFPSNYVEKLPPSEKMSNPSFPEKPPIGTSSGQSLPPAYSQGYQDQRQNGYPPPHTSYGPYAASPMGHQGVPPNEKYGGKSEVTLSYAHPPGGGGYGLGGGMTGPPY